MGREGIERGISWRVRDGSGPTILGGFWGDGGGAAADAMGGLLGWERVGAT